jgi:hypothetical protein
MAIKGKSRGNNGESREIKYKLVVFIPKSHTEVVRKAICLAGAGHIGKYKECTFMTEGVGSFLPSPTAKPTIGKKRKINFVSEVRLETTVTAANLNKVIKALLKSHPYEEVAYDLYEVINA